MRQNEVKTYYTELGEKEWLRLTNLGDGAVEFAVTTFTIASYLPPSGQILDIGGGPGRYAIWLAEQGHKVVLADLSPTLLDIARTKIAEADLTDHINEIVEVDVCDLSRWPEDSFDAVVCLGPFYHLPDPIERKRAALELIRVLKPGGVAFVAFMPLFGFLRRTLALEDERHHLEKPEWQAQLLGKGLFINEIPGRFNHGFGIRPEEIAPYFEQFGLKSLQGLGTEGISYGMQETLIKMKVTDPVAYRNALGIVIKTASDPSILGMCGHLLYVGQKL